MKKKTSYYYYEWLERSHTHIGVELANKAREIIMFEILRKQISSKFSWVPDDESRSIFVPGDDIINSTVFDQLVCFGQERRRKRSRRISCRRLSTAPLHRRRRHACLLAS